MSPMSLFRPASGNDAHRWTSMEEADVTSTVVPMHDRVAPRAARSIEPLVVGLIAIVFAGWRLAQQGLGNSYYTAADISGARSVHNLFFAAFDRTGIMAVDKPPLGLVAPAAAVHAFGVSSWSVLGPQVVMFGIGLALLHAAMRRWFSARAARIASLVMVLIPIDIVVARSNNPDELLTLFTIIGLIAAVEAMRDGHGRWVALCAAAVSLGFLTKFLQAFVGLPVLAAAVFFSVRGHRRLTRTAWFAALVAVGSLTWVEIVDHVASGRRPYVANSLTNSEFDLAFGFSGVRRIHAASHMLRNVFGGSYLMQATWLVPAALIGGALLASSLRGPRRSIVTLLLAWTVLHIVVATVMPGKFSPYYLAPLMPGVAALVGAALDASIPRIRFGMVERRPASAPPIIAAAVAASTLAMVALAVGRTHPMTVVGAASLAAVGLAGWRRTNGMLWTATGTQRGFLTVVPAVFIVAGLLFAPAHWAVAAVALPQTRVAPTSSLTGVASPTSEEISVSASDGALAAYVEAHQGAAPISMATSRVSVAARVVGDTNFAVAALGGFFGSGPFPTLGTLRGWIDHGVVRWVAVPDLPPGRRNVSAAVIARPWGPYVRTHCAQVPAGVFRGVNIKRFWRSHNHQAYPTPLDLYDCSKFRGRTGSFGEIGYG